MTFSKQDELDVLFEDNHLLVVNKPPLLPTMGVEPDEDSLYRRAGSYLRRKYNKPGNVYVGIVSRLDAFASGVIVMARTSKAASRLSDQIRRQVIEKEYLAIIPDGLEPPEGRLVDEVAKNENLHRMEVIDENCGGKRATLSYRTLSRTSQYQLLRIQLETGRKHQIRVQLQHAGFPIVGDQKYGSPLSFRCGIALHCHRLAFEHPTLRLLQSFQAEPPAWWSMNQFEKAGF